MWTKFKEEWDQKSETPKVENLPFKTGDKTNKGVIKFIDTPWKLPNGELFDILVKTDEGFVRASELSLIEQETTIENISPDESEKVGPFKVLTDLETVKKADIRVCHIIDAVKVPKKDRLINLTIDTGVDIRNVVTNLGQFFDVDSFIGKNMFFVLNLPVFKLANIDSNGMIVASTDTKGNSKLLTTDLEIGSTLL